jgi:hypothetical protein
MAFRFLGDSSSNFEKTSLLQNIANYIAFVCSLRTVHLNFIGLYTVCVNAVRFDVLTTAAAVTSVIRAVTPRHLTDICRSVRGP